MSHVMLDLETFGTHPGAVVRSIGACVFDPRGSGTQQEFYRNIDHDSSLAAGLTTHPDTVEWWKKQSREAQDSLLVDPVHVRQVFLEFRAWWQSISGEYVWAQGSNFDPVLWEAVGRVLDMQVPWRFWNAMDTRTAYSMGKINPFKYRREGTYHNALDDAKHQAMLVQKAHLNVS